MNIIIREYTEADTEAIGEIWNQVVDEGVAFPQEERLTEKTAKEFFSEQTYTGVAEDGDSGKTVGLYILHPNNIGRCGHICNASFAVERSVRGEHIGEKLVRIALTRRRKRVSG